MQDEKRVYRKRRIGFSADSEVMDDFKLASMKAGKSQQYLIREYIKAFVEKYSRECEKEVTVKVSGVDVDLEDYNRLKIICDKKRIPMSHVIELGIMMQIKRYYPGVYADDRARVE